MNTVVNFTDKETTDLKRALIIAMQSCDSTESQADKKLANRLELILKKIEDNES